jgi:hypothetical protein
MALDQESVARAFSGHRFDDAIPYLAEDISWTLIGSGELQGKQTVVDACVSQARELTDVKTEFERFTSIVAPGCVVVETLALYQGSGGDDSRVASCDIYHFNGEKVSSIRSYNMEVDLH